MRNKNQPSSCCLGIQDNTENVKSQGYIFPLSQFLTQEINSQTSLLANSDYCLDPEFALPSLSLLLKLSWKPMPWLGEKNISKMELSCQVPDLGVFLGRKHQGELQPFSKCERAFLEIHYTGHCLHCGIYTHLNIGQYFPAPLILAFRKLISPFCFGTFFIRFGNHKACKWKFQRCSLDLYCVQRDPAKRHNPFLTHLHFGISIQNPIFL